MICLCPLQVDSIFDDFVFIHQVAPALACWLFKTAATSWPFDLESGVQVTCDMGYLCANFSLPRPLCSLVYARCNVRERRQTKASLNASALWGGVIINGLIIACYECGSGYPQWWGGVRSVADKSGQGDRYIFWLACPLWQTPSSSSSGPS